MSTREKVQWLCYYQKLLHWLPIKYYTYFKSFSRGKLFMPWETFSKYYCPWLFCLLVFALVTNQISSISNSSHGNLFMLWPSLYEEGHKWPSSWWGYRSNITSSTSSFSTLRKVFKASERWHWAVWSISWQGTDSLLSDLEMYKGHFIWTTKLRMWMKMVSTIQRCPIGNLIKSCSITLFLLKWVLKWASWFN